MSQENNDIIYTAADIEKYHKGMLSARQMHAIEKAALDDPFLADALEGYAVSDVNSNADISELKNRLTNRIQKETAVVPIATTKKIAFSWWKVAAMIFLVAGAGLIVYQLGFNSKRNDLAQTVPKEKADNIGLNDSSKESSSTFLSTDTVSGLIATERQKNNIKIKSELTTPGSAASSEEKVTDTKADSLVKGKKEPAINEPAVTSNAPAVRNDDLVLNDEGYRKRSARKEGYVIKNQDVPKDSIASIAQQKPTNVTQDLGIEHKAKAQQNRLFNQTNVFRGRITDAHNNALPFSNITNTEDNIGTYSDAKGYFILTSPDSVLNVQISSVGFETNQVQLQNNIPTNNILLQEDRSLAEVVITNKKVNSNRSRDANMKLEEPEPADGWNNYDLYLANNLKAPEDIKDKQPDTSREVELSFEVDKNGTPFNITVKKSLCESCDKEAIRLVKEGPKWKRKARKGKATVKIVF